MNNPIAVPCFQRIIAGLALVCIGIFIMSAMASALLFGNGLQLACSFMEMLGLLSLARAIFRVVRYGTLPAEMAWPLSSGKAALFFSCGYFLVNLALALMQNPIGGCPISAR